MIEGLALPVSLIVVVLLVVKRVNYGLALILGALTLGILSKLDASSLLETGLSALTDRLTLELTFIVALIQVLALYMKRTGMVDKLISGVRSAISSRAVLAVLPAVMGGLPMPGGALLSAPLIEDEADRLKIGGGEKSFLNVWFRHWNFFIYPLSSPLILASALSGVDIYTLIAFQAPVLACYIAVGYLASLRRIEVEEKDRAVGSLEAWRTVASSLAPIALAVILTAFEIPMYLALTAAVVYVVLSRRLKPSDALEALKREFNWGLPLAIPGVMVFRYMVEKTNVVQTILPYMESLSLPPLLVVLAAAWIVGLATAMPSASVALVFPIASAMLGATKPALTSTVYISIIFSYLVSPMHLCLALTVEYYRSNLQTVYRRLIPSALAAYILSLSVLSVLRQL